MEALSFSAIFAETKSIATKSGSSRKLFEAIFKELLEKIQEEQKKSYKNHRSSKLVGAGHEADLQSKTFTTTWAEINIFEQVQYYSDLEYELCRHNNV